VARWHTWIGLGLIALAEAGLLADWESLTIWATPIAWWGLILVLDGVLAARTGRSPLLGRPGRLVAWTTASIAFWLVFEAYNLHLANWHYLGLPASQTVRLLGYVASFSTIIPGVFLTAQILTEWRAFGRADAVGRRPRLPLPPWAPYPLAAAGAVFLVVPILVPSSLARYGFGLVWLGFFLVLDPLNGLAGRPSLFEDWRRGLWGRTLRLLAAGFLCGLLWEMWNWGAATKWVYTVPILPSHTLFEMPAAGFLGFGPFALELFAMWHAAAGLWDAVTGRLLRPREPSFQAR
jgi:hypothetical protein